MTLADHIADYTPLYWFGGLIGLGLGMVLWLWLRDIWNRPITMRLDSLLDEVRRSRPALPPVTLPPGAVTCRWCGLVYESSIEVCPKCGNRR